jgi:site-specific DNA-methyltransferase (adenine-specific)
MTSQGSIIEGDCLKVLPSLAGGLADLVLTDPPYLVDYHDRSGRSIQGDKDGGWLKPAFAEIHRVMKEGGFCVCFYGWNRVDKFMAAWKSAGLRPVGHMVFVKGYESGAGALGYWHESAYLLQKGQSARQPNFILPDIQPWFYTGNKLHPTQKPVPSLKPIIEAFTQEGEWVLDPFCGSGSTLMAAKILGRKYVGIEVDPKFVKTARNRVESA